MFKATLYKIEGSGRRCQPETWTEVGSSKATTQVTANAQAARKANLGYGGHGRSNRTHDAIAQGQRVTAPLGTYQLVVEII